MITYLDDANPVSAATSVTAPAVAATLAEGDHVFVCVDFKRPGSATLPTPSGWSKIVDVQVGTGSAGAGTGPLQLVVFYAQAGVGGAITMPTLTLGGTTTGSVIQAGTIVGRGDAGATSVLQFAFSSGSDTSSGTDFSVTGGSDPGITVDDLVFLFGALTTTTPTFTAAPTISATGVTFGTVNNPWLTSTGTGDDARSFCYRTIATAGTATAAPTAAGTLDGASTGGAAFLRLREAVTLVEKTATDSATLTEGIPQIKVSKTETFTLSEVAVVTPIVPGQIDKAGSDSAALTEASSLAAFTGGTLIPEGDIFWGPDTYFGGEDGLDQAALTEASELSRTDHRSGVDGGTLSEAAQVSVIATKAGADGGALTGETAQVILVTPVGPSTDSATLDEISELTDLQAPEGVDAGTLSESSALTVMHAVEDGATLSEDRVIDRPGAVFEDAATLDETSELTKTTVGGPFWFAGDQYFGEGVYFGGGDGGPVDPGKPGDKGKDPDRDKGFTASKTGEETPADFAVLVALTTTGEIVDELAWSSWNYTDSIDWVRPGSATVRVPLLGRDRLGELNRRTLRDIDNSGPTVTLVLTRKGRALWAGPVFSTSWGDDAVDIACASIAKLMDSRMVINPAYLLDPGNEAGTVRLELSPRDRVVRLLQLGTTGERRTLPVQLPALTGEQGPLVEYLASDLGTVSERIREAVEADGGPDVAIRPELSLDQSRLVWKVSVEEHIGETTSQAAWDYPVSVKALSGETDSSTVVTTGYVLGDTQTSVGSIRGFGVHSIDRGRLQPAMERADRTSVSNKRQEELDALAVSYVEVNSTPARTWSITVHAEADPIIGEEWQLGDYVTISVSDHPWLDDGEYVRRVIGITHNPESISLETIPISEAVDSPDVDEDGAPVIPTPDPVTPGPVTPGPVTPGPVTPPPDPTPPPPDPTPPTNPLGIPWSQVYRDGSNYQIATGGTGTAQNLASLSSAASGGVYNYTGPVLSAATSLDFTGKSNITIRGIKMAQGATLRPKAGSNILLGIEAPYELTNGGEIVKWVGVYNKVRIDQSVFGPATEGTPPTVKSRYVQFGDATSVGAKYGTVTDSTFRCKAGPGNPTHAVGDTGNPTGGVRYTLVTGCLFQKVRPFDENDHEACLMGISTLQLTDGQTIIEWSRFEDCGSEPEVVSFKMNNSTLRGCTFVDHVGSASLRHGDFGKIHDCWFVSDKVAGPTGNRHAAGARVYGRGHEVSYCTIRVKGGANYERPILLDTGDAATGTTSNGHAYVEDVDVHHNLLVNCESPIVVGDNYGKAPTGQIRSNKIVGCANAGTTGIQVINSTSMAGITATGNQVFASTAAAGLTQGPNGEWKDPTGATGARVPFLTASMVGKGGTYKPWG